MGAPTPFEGRFCFTLDRVGWFTDCDSIVKKGYNTCLEKDGPLQKLQTCSSEFHSLHKKAPEAMEAEEVNRIPIPCPEVEATLHCCHQRFAFDSCLGEHLSLVAWRNGPYALYSDIEKQVDNLKTTCDMAHHIFVMQECAKPLDIELGPAPGPAPAPAPAAFATPATAIAGEEPAGELSAMGAPAAQSGSLESLQHLVDPERQAPVVHRRHVPVSTYVGPDDVVHSSAQRLAAWSAP